MEMDLTVEAGILGVCIIIAASCIDVKVAVNVTDKPIITSSKDVRNIIKNDERD